MKYTMKIYHTLEYLVNERLLGNIEMQMTQKDVMIH